MRFLTEVSPQILLIINAILIFIVTLLLGLIGYFFKRLLDSVDGRFAAADNKIEKERGEVSEIRDQVHSLEKSLCVRITEIHGTVESSAVAIGKQEKQIDKMLAGVSRFDNYILVQTSLAKMKE